MRNSAWHRAGAQWRTHAGPNDKEQQEWDLQTYDEWTKMIEDGKGKEAGLAVRISSLHFSQNL